MIREFIHENWKMRQVGDEFFVPATVPGTVYTDMMAAGKLEDPYYRDNEDKALRMMDNDFEYETTFAVGDRKGFDECDKVFLCFEMIDSVADVYLNGKLLGNTLNMHRKYEFDVKDLLTDANCLRVVLHSPNKYIKSEFEKDPVLGSEDCSMGFPKLRKAHYMFGWDWGPRLPDAGILRSVSLVGVRIARFDSVYVWQNHENGKVSLKIDPKIEVATQNLL